MDRRQFLDYLRKSTTGWMLYNGSIRSSTMLVNDFPSDTITYVANRELGHDQWGPTDFLDAARYLRMTERLAMEIATANDGRGDKRLRIELLMAVGLIGVRNSNG